MRSKTPWTLLALVAGGLVLEAQEPAGPPPAPGSRDSGSAVLELLPEIGKIGAQVGFLAGKARQPYEAGDGFQGTGFVQLPLAKGAGGRLSYEILVSLSDGLGQPFTITNPIAYVANLAAGADAASALAGPPRAPFPVRRQVRTKLRVLQVSPFALKHTFTGLGHARLRPYVTLGADAIVVISKQVPERDESLAFSGTAPFDDDLIGGLVAQSSELAAQGLPSGQGNLLFGFHAGGGLELRLSRGLSLNADYRYSQWDGDQRQHAFGGGLGFHW